MAPACLAAVLLVAVDASTALRAASAPALQGQLILRPLTPSEIKDYSLTGTQGASGLAAVGVGQPAYLEVLINAAIAPSNITSVTWTLTSKPVGSVTTLLPSPLGPNVPTYKMADRVSTSFAPVFQVAGPSGRTLLRPDVAGQYQVSVTIVTTTSGTTNLTQNITAGTYLGAYTCSLCHSGNPNIPNEYPSWSETPHASFLARAIDGKESDHYSKNCISCHTVGYDVNTNAVNGGFDDVMKQLGWSFPAVLTNGNWAAMPDPLKALGNIQCENCHGPGSEHVAALGNTNLANWPRIGKTWSAGTCAQCHDSKNTHIKNAEWNNSLHARASRTPSGISRPMCVRCHTAPGFAGWAEAGGMAMLNQYPTNIFWANSFTTNILTYTTNSPTYTMPATPPNTTYEAITCQACHDPHDASNPNQLRMGQAITLSDGTLVTNAGSGGFCMECHNSRNGSVTNSLVNFPLLKPTWAGGSAFGVHDSPQGDMLEGVNAVTYGKDIPSAAHRSSISNTCAGCHMQTVAPTDPAFLQAGGHTFHMTYTNAAGATLDKVDVCVKCHGPIASFDMVKTDYNGDGIIEGVQTEVQKLMDKLSTLLPNSTYRADGKYLADGLVKSSVSPKTNWQSYFLKGAYNFQFVSFDASKGVHNAPFAVGLLKASIADLTGDSNGDNLADAWQIQYFGSTTSSNAAPNACPAGDGLPNWLKYNLGLDPTVKGQSIPGGVVYANGTKIGGSTNTVQIFTAAEVSFNTEVGKTYQIQEVSSIIGTWQNLGSPIVGTGSAMSYVTPVRRNVQQYFRVVTNP